MGATTAALRRVIVGTDFGAGASDALDRAVRLPWASTGELCLLHVVRDANRRDSEARLRREASFAQRLADDAGSSAAIRARLVSGSVEGGLAAYAKAWGADLIVVGRSRSRGVRALVQGSTTSRIVRRSQVPVLVVGRCPDGPYTRPLASVDLERGPASLLASAARAVDAVSVVLRVLHVARDPFGLSASTDRGREERRAAHRAQAVVDVRRALDGPARALGLSFETLVVSGDPWIEVSGEVEHGHPDLVVVGTRARSGISRFFFGSVAERLVESARCDVLVVPDPARAYSSIRWPNQSAIAGSSSGLQKT
jgi:nucleotide-binding universal stress UspA family protein